MVIDPVNQGTMYAVGAYGAEGLLKSTDGGVTWTQLLGAGSTFGQLVMYNFVNNVSMDAANPLHLVIDSHGACAAPYLNGCIFESFDGGMTWPNVVQMPAMWGEKGGVQIINATTWIWGTGQQFNGLWVTTNNGHDVDAGPAGRHGRRRGRAVDAAAPARERRRLLCRVILQGILRSTDGVAWDMGWTGPTFGKPPSAFGLVLSPTTIFAGDSQSIYSAPISSYGSYKQLPTPAAFDANAYAEFLAYDEAHSLLYVSSWSDGVFRIVTQ